MIIKVTVNQQMIKYELTLNGYLFSNDKFVLFWMVYLKSISRSFNIILQMGNGGIASEWDHKSNERSKWRNAVLLHLKLREEKYIFIIA